MKVLFLGPYPAGQSPSQRFRLEHYLGYLSASGIRYDYIPFLDSRTWTIVFKEGYMMRKLLGVLWGYIRRFFLLFKLPFYDVVYVHRESTPLGPPFVEWFAARVFRRPMIYDFDDAIWVHAVSHDNKLAAMLKWSKKVNSICKWSRTVTTGNAYLAAYARQFNKDVRVIPTVVNTETAHAILKDQSAPGKIVIGWTGTFSTLKYLDLVTEALQRLEKKYDFEFLVIANKNPQLPLKNFRFKEWNLETEISDLLEMHIGLMPLTDDPISRGKCGFKAIQYMALGIPALVTPLEANLAIVDEGVNGYFCDSANEWEAKMALLLEDAQLRQEMGRAARKKIVEQYSVAATVEPFVKCLKG
jgi:glycosyltransferase involved in cell wall biosynthesis